MQTPIEDARNLGPITGAELRSIGIDTLEKLRAVGWEQVYLRLIEAYPVRLHLILCYALIGAIHGVDLKLIPSDEKTLAKQLNKEIRRERQG
jgi:hypothetical protein